MEYLSSLVKNENQPPVFSSNRSIRSSSEKIVFPTTLMCLIVATVPSLTSIAMETRFLGSAMTSESILASYLPCNTYCRCNSNFIPSRVERWNTCPTASPAPFNPSSSASVSMALLPSMVISLMLGRSATITTSTPPSRAIEMSSKFPVAKRLLAAALTP